MHHIRNDLKSFPSLRLIHPQVLVKDSNVVCVAEAAGCLGALAKGLRKEFASAAKAHFGNLLDKLKDKNSNVCSQSAQACINFHK